MKLGVLGSGMIVPQFLDVCKEFESIDFVSICGTERSVEKLKKLEEKYSFSNFYTEIEEFLLEDFEVVYLGIPNNLHYEIGKKILESGKSVIMEKPFTENLIEAQNLIDIARDKGLFIFEAISNQFLPNYLKVRELINNLGDIKIVQLNYSQYSSRYDAFKKGEIAPVFDKNKGGGSLVDLGVYNIYFVVGLFGEPQNVYYFYNEERGVDTSGILIMEYQNFQCVCINAKDCEAPLSINIQGDKGNIHSKSASNTFESFVFELNNKDKEEFALNENKHRLYFEVEKFLEIYENKDYESLKELNEKTLAVMRILEKAKNSEVNKFL